MRSHTRRCRIPGALFLLGFVATGLATPANAAPPGEAVTLTLGQVRPKSHPAYGVTFTVANRLAEPCDIRAIVIGDGPSRPLTHPKTVAAGATIPVTLGSIDQGWLQAAGQGLARAVCGTSYAAASGLRGTIATPVASVRAGEDIHVRFAVGLDSPERTDTLHVWDSKFSNGYRSWWFEVRGPDGKVRVLRRPVQDTWDKNAPHAVAITAGSPYALVGWGTQAGKEVGGQHHFSLVSLGLDTSAPGAYAVTGFFEQDGGKQQGRTFWGGRLVTNRLAIDVAR